MRLLFVFYIIAVYGWWSPQTPNDPPYSMGFFCWLNQKRGLFGKVGEVRHAVIKAPISVSVDGRSDWAVFGLDHTLLIRSSEFLEGLQREVLASDYICTNQSGCMSHLRIFDGTIAVGESTYKASWSAVKDGPNNVIECRDSPECHESMDVVLIKKSNCGVVEENLICRDARKIQQNLNPTCFLERDEDPLLSEYLFSRLADAEGIGAEIEKLSSKSPENCRTKSSEQHPVFSRVLIVSAPGKSLSELISSLPMGIDRFVIATRMFIQCLDLIKMLHVRGVVHGSLTDKVIRFASDIPSTDLSSDTYHRLVLTDFGSARFYPTELGTPSKIMRGVWSMNPHSTPFELSGHRYGRRDDVYRLFEAYIGWLSGSMYWGDMQLFSGLGLRDADKQETRLEFLKKNLDFFKSYHTESKTPNVPLDFDPGLKRLIKNDERIRDAIYWPYLRELETILSEQDFHMVSIHLTRMMQYLRGGRNMLGGAIPKSPRSTLVSDFLNQDDMGQDLENADSNPSYKWLAYKANNIHDILIKHLKR